MLSRLPKSTLVPLAFASVYLIWGSTYTAIHVAGETLPPPVVTTARATLSTLLVVVICLLRGKSLRVPRDEMWKLALVGVLFMTVNNTLLTWGETMVPSGYASLVVATTPIMVALIERALPGGDAMNARGWAGTLLGTLGIAVLVWPSLHETRTVTAHYRPGLAIVVLLVAALAFAVGQVLGRRFHLKADTFVATGWQLGASAVGNTVIMLVSGDARHGVWTWRGAGAIAYLATIGSLVGLVAFTYLLKNVAVSKVATYAFVNPVVAVMLGMVLLHERLNAMELAGTAVVVCAVAMVIYSRMDRGKREIVGETGHALE